ncbi:hypothetical protein ASD56_15395 [Microbacterium sp. Root166]|uniref:DUF4190 domain-containing protein n=1 Tax=Microbacterium sp. Root166 TaxID=1736478 RepID=UPI0007016DB2|nr:DUF4190 domain-containing protein [Microbacterium sp. Root166]KQZ82253.1 hypothetical protein ASD56_15395 [Microbacterium sp. Root166]
MTDPTVPSQPAAGDSSVPPAPPQYQAAPPAAPSYAAAPSAGPVQPGAEDPGKTLGIIALVAVFFISILGLILGYVARGQSKKAGFKNTPAKVAIILGWIFLALTIIAIILAVVFAAMAAGALADLCAGMDPGVYTTDTGLEVTCP